MDPWFPRSIDVEEGGFLCDFDRQWASSGPHDKFLEFQARQALAAADASRHFPSDPTLRDAALHGFRYLHEVMWDSDAGGWFHRMDRGGKPLEGETKHVHGMAYAIEACAAIYQATGQTAAMDLAREGFEWLERCARDREHGGYFAFLTRDGKVISSPSDCPWDSDVDTIGTVIGLKDLNVHSDLLETFVELYRVWPHPTVAERLDEIIEILSTKMLNASTESIEMFVTADWQPIPHPIRTGHQLQTSYRLLLASRVTHAAPALVRFARRLADSTTNHAYDRDRGGFVFAAPGDAPSRGYRDQDVRAPLKYWWVQLEALRTFLALSQLDGDNASYRELFESQWQYVERNLIDTIERGFYTVGLDVLPRRQRWLNARFAPADITKKGDVWKDASHDARALLHCIEMLTVTP